MPSFRLANNTEVAVEINVDTLKRCRSLLDIDLAAIFANDLLDRLYRDPVLLCDVLFVCCEPSLTRLKIDDVQFGRQLHSGETISEATSAFFEALANFTPPVSRPAIIKAIAKIRTIQDKETSLAIARIDSPLIDQMVERQHQKLMDDMEHMMAGPTTAEPTPE